MHNKLSKVALLMLEKTALSLGVDISSILSTLSASVRLLEYMFVKWLKLKVQTAKTGN